MAAIAEMIAGIAQGATNTGVGLYNANMSYENARYQRYQQHQEWQREDRAVQRRVEDLRAAGLSPTLAAGSAAVTGQALHTDAARAPEIDIQSPIVKGIELDAYLKQTNANVANTLADKELKMAEKNRIDQMAIGEEIDNITRSTRNDLGLEFNRAQITHISNQDREIGMQIARLAAENDSIRQQIRESEAKENLLRQQLILAWQEGRQKDIDYYKSTLDTIMEERESMIDMMLNTRRGGTSANIRDIGKVWDLIKRHVLQGKSQDTLNEHYTDQMLDLMEKRGQYIQSNSGVRR